MPPEVAVARIVERDGKTEEEARRRVSSQMTNQERVEVASTVVCSLWEPEVTARQVEEAVVRLEGELGLARD